MHFCGDESRKSGLQLLASLSSNDIEWLIAHGRERQTIANTVIIEEGTFPKALVFVLEGLVEIRIASLPTEAARKLGPGELLGDMAFLEGRPASATVAASENSLLLEIPFDVLRRGLDEQPEFAVRLYRCFALTAMQRLRARESRMGQWVATAETHAASRTENLPRVEALLESFKHGLKEADAAAIKGGIQVDEDVRAKVAWAS